VEPRGTPWAPDTDGLGETRKPEKMERAEKPEVTTFRECLFSQTRTRGADKTHVKGETEKSTTRGELFFHSPEDDNFIFR